MPQQWHISCHDHCFSLLQLDYYWVARQMLEKRQSESVKFHDVIPPAFKEYDEL